MKLIKWAIAATLLSLAQAQPVRAGGTLPLSEILPLINQSPKLSQEINNNLEATGQSADNVTCAGVRLGRHFGSISASRVAPFSCYFDNRQEVEIKADNFVKLPNGRSVTLEQFLQLKPMPESATLYFRLKTWHWKQSN